MADYSITAANVHIYEGVRQPPVVQFGETMTPGMSCYLKASDSKWWKADANGTELSDSTRLAVVVVGAAADAYGLVVEYGPIDLGTTLTVGVPVIVSTTAGGIAPVTDWSGYSTSFQYHLGYATAADTLFVRPYKTGASVA